ncbi:hypothetical protein KUTeg_014036 [Tegillarca granosa]|uniref:PBZ-type domain-containing protein n=1 Tax=Tegillarca granosa TaxID=220873 RepID=A0ABQ9EZV7_TEGGR|nr:hypothetical protein KUTeg_014036 [Tegillarca granosa]
MAGNCSVSDDELFARKLQAEFDKEMEMSEKAKRNQDVSDSDSDITIEPDPPDWEILPSDLEKDMQQIGGKRSDNRTTNAVTELTKRRSKTHDLSDSEEDTEEYVHSQNKDNASTINGSSEVKLNSHNSISSSKKKLNVSHHLSESDSDGSDEKKCTDKSNSSYIKTSKRESLVSKASTKTNSSPKSKLNISHDLSDSDEGQEKKIQSKLSDVKSKKKVPVYPLIKASPKKKLSVCHDLSDSDGNEDQTSNSSQGKIYRTDSPVNVRLKRKQTELLEEENENSNARPKRKLQPCKFGSKCYRKNPSHFEEFSHPDDESRPSTSKGSSDVTPPPKKKMRTDPGSSRSPRLKYKSPADVYKEAQPLSFFLTKVSGIPDEFNTSYAMDLKDILSPTMGNLTASCQFNYMFEIPWIMKQYPEPFRSKPLLVVHGFQGPNKAALQAEAAQYTNIKFCQARLEMAYGTHHTKMMLLLYDDGMRVVIHTSNLIERDWFQKTQGMWISPLFPKLKPTGSKTSGDSPTRFKHDLLEYIASYKAYQLKEWQEHVSNHDMSSARVFIIGSSPGRHIGEKKHSYGHMKLRKVLNENGPPKDQCKSWPVIGQFSSIGSLGPDKQKWLCAEFLQSLATVKGSSSIPLSSINFQLIFPTKDNVRTSLEGYSAGASIPYSIHVAKKQQYLHTFFHHWKSNFRGRNRAMPHIKTYGRPSPSSKEMAWFLVTSANLSKAAWGGLEKNGSQLMIRSYEIGVLFTPKCFGIKEMFSVTNNMYEIDKNTLPLPWDLPLKPYVKGDKPWIWDISYKDLPDSNGNMWCPS